MLQVQGLTKYYGAETVLLDVSFAVNVGERVALLGPNGCGKSTLLRIIAGEEVADSGHVSRPDGFRLGYLPQGLRPIPGESLRMTVQAGVEGWQAALSEIEHLADRMALPGADLDRVMPAYDRALAHFEALGGYGVEHRADALLAELGLGHVSPETPVERLSGGEQSRALLASVLLADPDLLLLDEPTNHLDIAALEWLEEWLAAFDGAALIVSHDRTFLDRTVNRVLALDDRTHRVTSYAGGYSSFAAERAAETERQWAAWRDQQEEIRQIKQDIHHTKMQAMSVEKTTTPRQPSVRRYAKKVAKKGLAREKKLERYLAGEERVEKPEQRWQIKLDLDEVERGSQQVLQLDGVGYRFDDGPWLFRDVSRVLGSGERIALLGPNGSGKSTLLQIVVGKLMPAEGSVRIGPGVSLGYMPQKQDALDPMATPLTIIRQVRAMSETDARNLLHQFLFAGDDALMPVGRLSYGERSRLLLARLVAREANFLVLDEPVNHLDIPSREQSEAALLAFPGTILMAVHDRTLIDRLATRIWQMEDGSLGEQLT